MNAGKVDALLILGGNPVYTAPSDFQFTKALQKVKTSMYVSLHFNETALKTTWHVPEPHWLEDWGDARAYDGTVSIVQPLIAPMYSLQSYVTVLDAILQFPGRTSYEIVRAYWQGHTKAPDFEAWWRKSVHDGLIASSALPAIDPGQPKPFTAARRRCLGLGLGTARPAGRHGHARPRLPAYAFGSRR